MSHTLRILLGEHWPDHPVARWVVVDERGQVINSGESEPRQWPAANRVEAILYGPQTSWLKVRVPKAGLREQAAAISFAIEEQIVREADSQHITPTLQLEDAWHVLIISRERMKRLLAQFAAISRPLDAVYSALQTLPLVPNAWAAGTCGEYVSIRSAAHDGWSEDFPPGTDAPALLQLAISQAREAGTLPTQLSLFGMDDKQLVAVWQEQLLTPIEAVPTWAWYAIDNDTTDLLHGEFLPHHRHKAWQRALRPVVIGLAVIFFINLLFGTGYAWWRGAELNQIKKQMEQLMHTQLPNEPMLDPVAQLLRELNQQRNQHGMLATDAALSLLADLSTALGPDAIGAVKSLRYQEGALELSLNPGPLNPQALQTRLHAKGLSVTQREADGKIIIRRIN